MVRKQSARQLIAKSAADGSVRTMGAGYWRRKLILYRINRELFIAAGHSKKAAFIRAIYMMIGGRVSLMPKRTLH